MSASNQIKQEDVTMKKNTLGRQIAALRKNRELTQQQLAEQMGVTDKAVSKWERDLSLPRRGFHSPPGPGAGRQRGRA